MTREEFIKVLDEKGYSYEIVGDKIVVTHSNDVWLETLKTIPPGVEFKNGGNVYLNSLETLPPGMVFNNRHDVFLKFLETLPPDVEFKNEGDVLLNSLVTLPPGVGFKNGGNVYLEQIFRGRFKNWPSNIEGVSSNRLLNFMISKGLFI